MNDKKSKEKVKNNLLTDMAEAIRQQSIDQVSAMWRQKKITETEKIKREISSLRYNFSINLGILILLEIVFIAVTVFLCLTGQPLWSILLFLLISVLILCGIIGCYFFQDHMEKYSQENLNDLEKFYDDAGEEYNRRHKNF